MHKIYTLYLSSVSSIHLRMYPSIRVSPGHTFLSSCQSSASPAARPRGAQPGLRHPQSRGPSRCHQEAPEGLPEGRQGLWLPSCSCCVTPCGDLQASEIFAHAHVTSRPRSLEGSFAGGTRRLLSCLPLFPALDGAEGLPPLQQEWAGWGVPPGTPRLLGCTPRDSPLAGGRAGPPTAPLLLG